SLSPGIYRVVEVSGPYWSVTQDSLLTTTLLAGQNLSGLDIGNRPANRATVGGVVWDDANDNGIRDPGEATLDGTTVNLLGKSNQVLKTVNTSDGGLYSFEGLIPDDVASLHFALPADAVFSRPRQGTDPTLDSDVDPATGQISLTLLPNDNR